MIPRNDLAKLGMEVFCTSYFLIIKSPCRAFHYLSLLATMSDRSKCDTKPSHTTFLDTSSEGSTSHGIYVDGNPERVPV